MCYPLLFRQHILKVKAEEGLTYKETSVRFRVGLATLFRWARCLEPQTTRVRPPSKIDNTALRQQVIDRDLHFETP